MNAVATDIATTIRLWPYTPGVYGRDALYRVWKAMEDDGATAQAFWDEANGPDLATFVQMFTGPQRLLLMVERVETGTLCGCFWVGQMASGHQAFVGMWMAQASRGEVSIEAARQALRYTFEAGQFRQLWCLTPWPAASALCRAMGFMLVARLKAFCQWESSYKDVAIFRLTKEAFDGLDIQKG